MPSPNPQPMHFPAAPPSPRRHLRLVLILCAVVVAMVLVAFVLLPPIYTFFCTKGGGQYRPNNLAVANAPAVATGRYIEVFFESKVFDNLPVKFWADQGRELVEAGGDGRNVYHFQNLSDKPVRFRPIHQVNPGQVAKSFGMKVCFCFNDQEIGPGETRDWPVIFAIAPDVDPRIKDMTICYSLLALVDGESKEASEQRVRSTTGGQGEIVTPRFSGSGQGAR